MSPTGRYGPNALTDGTSSGKAVAAPAKVGFIPIATVRRKGLIDHFARPIDGRTVGAPVLAPQGMIDGHRTRTDAS